ncbi:hypothetical protein Pelo_19781 [Pelomyxa schiedti]|nr:hypothetical protein Pelo_19781 [Pelomyxa schiedti]
MWRPSSSSRCRASTRATVEGRIASCEHVLGNVFRARCFPVPKREGRTVKIEFITEITRSYQLRSSCSMEQTPKS